MGEVRKQNKNGAVNLLLHSLLTSSTSPEHHYDFYHHSNCDHYKYCYCFLLLPRLLPILYYYRYDYCSLLLLSSYLIAVTTHLVSAGQATIEGPLTLPKATLLSDASHGGMLRRRLGVQLHNLMYQQLLVHHLTQTNVEVKPTNAYNVNILRVQANCRFSFTSSRVVASKQGRTC